jgi:YrbI family 3-deoxy-D-manno-octulosonate 8-phosphate phosphatase
MPAPKRTSPAAPPPAFLRRLERIRLVVCDVDGVLTDGGLYYDARGGVAKRFDVHDGHGLVKLARAGIGVVFLSNETAPAVAFRARKLGVTDVRQGVADKARELAGIARAHRVAKDEILYIGDDEVDVAPMRRCGAAVAVADAVPAAKRAAHYVCARPGGRGAVREVADLLLAARRPRAARNG